MRWLIAALGESTGEVAASLRSLGARGSPGRAVDPLESYLHAVMGADPAVDSVMVHPLRVVVRRRGPGRPVEVPLPQAAQRFVVAFAAGCYPALHGGARRRGRGGSRPAEASGG